MLFKFRSKDYNFFPTVGLKLTGACRLHCPFCCEPDRNQPIVPVSSMIKITDNLYKAGTRRLCLTGGDPLLYPELSELLEHSKTVGFDNVLLTADGYLLKQKSEILKYVKNVRLSVHEIGLQQDDIVGLQHSFKGIQIAINLIKENNIPVQVTTVVTPLNYNKIFDIANWCLKQGVTKYYLFGLMRSGKGVTFEKIVGSISADKLEALYKELKEKYKATKMEIVLYKYSNNAECILVYGDGRVIIDPYPRSSDYQLNIGNILIDPPKEIIKRFLKEPDNYKGYCEHLKQA